MLKLSWQTILSDYFLFSNEVAEWEDFFDTPVVSSFKEENPDAPLLISDLSSFGRVGIKGQKTLPSLMTMPINGVIYEEKDDISARLGKDEWLLLTFDSLLPRIIDESKIQLLPRRDSLFCFGLGGEGISDCISRLSPLSWPSQDLLLQTRILNFSGIIIPGRKKNQYYYLGDISYVLYAWKTLTTLVSDCGGSVVGWKAWRNQV